MHFADDVVLVERSLHRHFLIGVHGAGARRGIECKASVARPEFDAAGAGFELPIGSRIAGDLDVARSGTGTEASIHVFQFDTAGAGLGLPISLAGLLGIDVARAGVDVESALQASGTDAARTGSEFCIPMMGVPASISLRKAMSVCSSVALAWSSMPKSYKGRPQQSDCCGILT